MSGPLTHGFYNDLIYDLGVNRGEDCGFYLDKGFRVIGVEANPALYEVARQKFAARIACGDLTLLNVGIASAPGALTFYINEQNDHWSSFDRAYGTRMGTPYRTVDIPSLTLDELVRRHGLPRYMKIDIEGADRHALQSLAKVQGRPPFISVEEYGVEALDDLHRLGYSHMKILGQRIKDWAKPPQPPREGRFVERQSSGLDSGLFGLELPGEWLPYAKARDFYVNNIRRENFEYIGPEHEWWDIHAALDAALAA